MKSKTVKLRASLAVQWLRLHTSNTVDTGLNPGRGTKICVARPKSKMKQSNSEKQRVAWQVPGAGGWAWRGVCQWFTVSVTQEGWVVETQGTAVRLPSPVCSVYSKFSGRLLDPNMTVPTTR